MSSKHLLHAMNQLEDSYIEEAATCPVRKYKARSVAAFTTIAACLLLIVGAGLVMNFRFPTAENNPGNPGEISSSPTPGGRKILEYNGFRYAFLEDGATFDYSAASFIRELGTNHTATFAEGGILYELPSYSPDFRVAVLYDNSCYIAGLVGRSDNEPMEIEEYLKRSDLKNQAVGATISDHMGLNALSQVSGDDTGRILNALSHAQIAPMTEQNFEALASAQSNGNSYLLSIMLEDHTAVEMYFVPSLGYISVGDTLYLIPLNITAQIAGLFEGLEQGPLPLS